MAKRDEEGASLLSNTSIDTDSPQDEEKVNPLSTSKRKSVLHGMSMLHLCRFRATLRQIRSLIALAAAILIFGLLFVHGPRLPAKLQQPFSNKAASRLQRPKDTKIVGLIFFGRRDRASILDCYLKKNLASKGGWLDEVVWGVNTDDTDDLAYLDELLPTSSAYRKVELQDRSYFGLWNESVEAGNIYVKLDDDVVYIDDDAIPLIVGPPLLRDLFLYCRPPKVLFPAFPAIHPSCIANHTLHIGRHPRHQHRLRHCLRQHGKFPRAKLATIPNRRYSALPS